ncbi:hypothetical protein F511_10039 [Dorcoceras hygrometricum]|uniref:Uncharacterized protein n=1 Tax=Dorcoceras hygrometricum TaxID=472368 RepID=A0A2Z7ABN5_9LAMI|nr:hypothetical protein F511_10039 [Dorcoceras hygrometricum]
MADCRKPRRDAKKRPDRSANKDKKEKELYRKGRTEKEMVAEENKSAWADSDSEESSSGTSSSSESEDEVQCLMADDTEEVFDFYSPEFTREDIVTALKMVLEYTKLSQSFEEVKAERESCAKNTELVSSRDMKAALSKLETENENLRSRSSASLQKLHGATKPSGDKIGLGYNSDEDSTAKTSSTPRLERTKSKTMNFVRSRTEQLSEEKSDKDKIAAQPPIWKGRFCGLAYTAPEKSR